MESLCISGTAPTELHRVQSRNIAAHGLQHENRNLVAYVTARFRVSQSTCRRQESGRTNARDSPRDDLDGARLVMIWVTAREFCRILHGWRRPEHWSPARETRRSYRRGDVETGWLGAVTYLQLLGGLGCRAWGER